MLSQSNSCTKLECVLLLTQTVSLSSRPLEDRVQRTGYTGLKCNKSTLCNYPLHVVFEKHWHLIFMILLLFEGGVKE
jgi:hypothetical protein